MVYCSSLRTTQRGRRPYYSYSAALPFLSHKTHPMSRYHRTFLYTSWRVRTSHQSKVVIFLNIINSFRPYYRFVTGFLLTFLYLSLLVIIVIKYFPRAITLSDHITEITTVPSDISIRPLICHEGLSDFQTLYPHCPERLSRFIKYKQSKYTNIIL